MSPSVKWLRMKLRQWSSNTSVLAQQFRTRMWCHVSDSHIISYGNPTLQSAKLTPGSWSSEFDLWFWRCILSLFHAARRDSMICKCLILLGEFQFC